MSRQLQSLAIAAVIALWQSAAFAAQTWTYQFTPTSSQPYNMSCGECGSYVGANADVAGTFTLLLDWDTHTGKILVLDDYLVNVVDEIYNGPGLGTSNVPSNPSTRDYGIVPPWHQSRKFTPGQITYTNGLGHLTSSGVIETPGATHIVGPPYEVWFTPSAATLNMTVPIMDYYITVTGATAAFQSSAWSGDLNHDGRVDRRDYLLLRKSTGPLADYDAWRWSYGNTYFATGSSTVPEPATCLLLLTSSASLLFSHRGLGRTR